MRYWYRESPVDFGAFYSAGRVVLQHQDAYLTEPLFSIERQVAGPNELLTSVDAVPLPAYDLVALSFLARLPLHIATVLFGLLTLAALAAIAYAMGVMSPISLPLAFAAAFYGMVYLGFSLGQLAPLAIAGIALGSVFVRTDQPIAASLCIGIALIQPQFAIPALISCLLFVPRMRVALSAIVVLLCAVSLSLGTATVFEYLKVLTLHARAELASPFQYSLSWLLSRAGFSESLALSLGTLSYFATLLMALIVLARHRDSAIKSGAVVLLPAALAVCGGSYVHVYQGEVALLTAVILARKSQWAFDTSIAAGLFITPFFLIASSDERWPQLSVLPTILFSFVTVWAVTYYLAQTHAPRERLRIASTHTAIIAAYFLALVFTRPPLHHLFHLHSPPAIRAHVFASENLRLTVLATDSELNGLPWLIWIKLPTWFALLFTGISAARTLSEGVGGVGPP